MNNCKAVPLQEQARRFLKAGTPWVAVPGAFLEDVSRLAERSDAASIRKNALREAIAIIEEVPFYKATWLHLASKADKIRVLLGDAP